MKLAVALRHQYLKRSDRILGLLDLPVQAWTMDEYHVLRVEIKKLMALLSLIKDCNPDFKHKKVSRIMKAIFAPAGNIRETQILISALKHFQLTHSLPGYIQKLNQDLETAIALYESDIRERLKRNFRKASKKCLSHMSSAKRKKATAYLSKKKEELARMLTTQESDSRTLHDLRKKIKDLFFLEKFVLPGGQPDVHMYTLQEMIGTWHDEIVMCSALSQSAKDEQIPRSEREVLANLLNIMSLEGERLQHKIIETLQDLYPPDNGDTHIS